MKDLQNNSTIVATLQEGYVIAFRHPKSGEIIFLANCADIRSICYSKYPTLPGTQNIKKAKVYYNLEDAKSDIYLLRYHHRAFLKIIIFAKHVLHFHAERIIEESDPQLSYYSMIELVAEES